MKVLHSALAAGLVALFATSAAAQYYPYGAPASLPAPTSYSSALARRADKDPVPPRPIPEATVKAGAVAGHGVAAGVGGAHCDGCCGAGSMPCHAGCGGCCDMLGGLFGGNHCCGPLHSAWPGMHPCNCWFVGVTGLYMTRDNNDPVWTSYESGVNDSVLLGTPDADFDDWQEGFEITIGRRIGCHCALAATYWTLDPEDTEQTITDDGGQISSSLLFNDLEFAGNPVQDLFDNAQAHRLRMRYEIHNFEINLLSDVNVCNPCSPIRFGWSTGFRFFRFSEDFEFASSRDATTFDDPPQPTEAFYDIDVENNLFGWQTGGRIDYQVACYLSLFAEGRFGVYYNHIEHESSLYNGDGDVATNLLNGAVLDVSNDASEFSTLGQLDVGFNYRFGSCCNWNIYGGYRVLAASGVALTGDQIPTYVADIESIEDVDSNGRLLLHGGFAGVSVGF